MDERRSGRCLVPVIRRVRLVLFVALVFVLIILGSCIPLDDGPHQIVPGDPNRIPVMFDTDICDDIDDTWALALLLQSPEFDVKLVTTAVGNTQAKAKVVAKFLETVGRTDVPVGVGVRQRDGSHRQTPWAEDYNLSAYPGKVYGDGVQAMIDMIMSSDEKITLIAVGPLPNIAEALKREPRIAEKAQLVGMHGSVRKGYGGRDEPSAEYNVRADVEASKKVFTAPWDITITPLDTCGIVHLKGAKYQKLLQRQSPLTIALLENYRVWYRRGLESTHKDMNPAELQRRVDEQLSSQSTTLFDTVAIYLAMSTELVKMESLPIEISDTGYTRIETGAKTMDCAMEWKDLGAFEDLVVDRLIK